MPNTKSFTEDLNKRLNTPPMDKELIAITEKLQKECHGYSEMIFSEYKKKGKAKDFKVENAAMTWIYTKLAELTYRIQQLENKSTPSWEKN